MTVKQTGALTTLTETESQTFVDVPGMSLVPGAGGEWAVFFSCVIQPDVPFTVEFRVVSVVDGVVTPGSTREIRVDIMAKQIHRCFSLEGITPITFDADDVVKIQWRVDYGKATIGDRKLTVIQ